MAIKKFKVEVIRKDEYIVEIDESIYDEEWRKKFETVFWPITELTDIAMDLALHKAEHGNSFKEGYGYINNPSPYMRRKDYAPGLFIRSLHKDTKDVVAEELEEVST